LELFDASVGIHLMSDNQRVNERFAVHWRGRLLLPDKSMYQVSIKNISKGGVGIIFMQALPAGSNVHLEFHIPVRGESHRIRVKCVVAYQTILSDNRGAKIGLMFSGIKGEDFHALSNTLQELTDARG
jgi:hypothetical protein